MAILGGGTGVGDKADLGKQYIAVSNSLVVVTNNQGLIIDAFSV